MDWVRFAWSAGTLVALPILMLLSTWGIDRAKGYKASLSPWKIAIPFVAAILVLEFAQWSDLITSRESSALFAVVIWLCYSIVYAILGAKRA
jgi:hypothetical protein